MECLDEWYPVNAENTDRPVKKRVFTSKALFQTASS